MYQPAHRGISRHQGKGKVASVHHEGVLGEWRYSSNHSLTSAIDGGEWSASHSDRFIPKERAPRTHWIGAWMGPSVLCKI